MGRAEPATVESRTRRRDQIAAAAVDVLATQGLRGLTHRAVDSAAGLNAGSVNYHAPTRAHLIRLALEELFARDLAVVSNNFGALAESSPMPIDAVVDYLTEFVRQMTTPPARDRVIARHVLLGEAQHDSEIRAMFDTQRSAFVAFAQHILTTNYPDEPGITAELVVIVIEGLIQRQVLIGESPLGDELRAIIAELFRPR